MGPLGCTARIKWPSFACRILERAGKTPAEVIRDMWVNISITGELPTTQQQIDEFEEKRRKFHEFIEFVESAPPVPEWSRP